MITQILSAYKGIVNLDLEKIKSEIAELIYNKLSSTDIPEVKKEKQTWTEHDADLQAIFGRRFITLNSKNVEYEEEFSLTDFVMSDKVKKVLEYFDWKDLHITLTVYRLGQYSYFNVRIDYVLLAK